MTPTELRAVGEALYGPVWQSKMARELGVSSRCIRRWLSGERRIGPLAERAIRSLVVSA